MRIATFKDVPRLVLVATAAFHDSANSHWYRQKHGSYPLGTLAFHAHMLAGAIRDAVAVVLVVKDAYPRQRKRTTKELFSIRARLVQRIQVKVKALSLVSSVEGNDRAGRFRTWCQASREGRLTST